MKILYVLPVALLLAVSSVHAGGGNKMSGHHGKKGHKGAVPMLMHTIKKNAAVLGLSDEQLANIDEIHDSRKASCHDMKSGIKTAKKAMKNAVLDGESAEEILARSKAINSKRNELISLRLEARDAIRDVLTDAQWYMAVGITKKTMHDKQSKHRGMRGGKHGHKCKHHGKKGGMNKYHGG